MQSLRNGTQLGVYTIIQLMARGGMGEVYEAHEINLQRRVALKVIAPRDPDDHDRDELIRRFLQEARTLARVNHPNIVTIYAIDSVGEIPFIAMEYIEGISFKELLKEFVLTAEAAAPLFEQMLDGLRCLHENRIVHRDLKPHNILVRPDGHIKILDFGIAKHASAGEYTQVGVVVGTLPYMAPELRSGVPASAQSDFWSLGAIFYECLVGTPLIVAMKDADNNREVPFAADSRIPADMKAIIQKMCAFKPADRYQSAVQAIEDLKRFQATRTAQPPEVKAAFATKIAEIADSRRKKQEKTEKPATGSIPPALELTPHPVTTPKVAPIDLMLSQDSLHPASRQHTRTRKLKKRTFLERMNLAYAGGALGVLILLVALWGFWPKSKPSPVVAKPSPPVAAPTEAPKTVYRPPRETLALKEPRANQALWVTATEIPTLKWTTNLAVGEYEVQIARDASFSSLAVHEPVSGIWYRPARVLPEGTYYWRLVPVKSDQIAPPPNSFTVHVLAPVDLISPDTQEVVSLKKRGDTADVELKWKCHRGTNEYRVQVALEPQFLDPTYDLMASGCIWSARKLDAGRYFWRARLEDARASELWSETRSFTVRPPDQLRLAKPTLNRKSTGITLAFNGAPRDIASLSKSVKRFPTLDWNPVKNAKSYLVQLSTSPTFSHLLSEEKTRATKLQWKGVTPGRIYWRVAAVGPTGEPGSFSERADIDVKLPAPVLPAKTKFRTDKKNFDLTWVPVPLAQKYLVQMGPTRTLAGGETKLVSAPSVNVGPEPGQHFIRVATVDTSGEVTSAFSNVAEVQVESAPEVQPPRPIMPKRGSRVAIRGKRISVTFSWSKMKDVVGYELEIASDPEFQHLIRARETKSSSIIIKQADFKGTVYWRVRTRGLEGNSDWSEPSFFEVN